ncbi:MAG TPA: hypothetical protein VFT64_08370 [Rickettsiales bacterium]|nr:hypothetical protein [Rickettsiales bacterium]
MSSADNGRTNKKSTESKPRKRLAAADTPEFEAIINGLFRFADRSQAMQRLEAIHTLFETVRKPVADNKAYPLQLWIKDYDLSDADIRQGYRGHFGGISIIQYEDGKYGLKLTKLYVPLSLHPQKTRPKRSHPDWGHPVLRQLKEQPVFNDVERARALLMALHEEYPAISIPGLNHLLIMLYSKEKKAGQKPVKKYKFSIVAQTDGSFRITYQENTKRKAPAQATRRDAEQQPKGRFTAMVALKRNKRKPSA